MSATSVLAGGLSSSAAVTSSQGGNFFTRVLNAIMSARELQAQREVDRYLARQPDRMLKDIGFDDAGIAELRMKHLV